jgi:uncharacterized lipoprotein YmbA
MLLAMLAVNLLSGCSVLKPKEDATRFFVLRSPDSGRPVAESAGRVRRLKVGLLGVEVPQYLKTGTMAVRRGETEIAYPEFSRWAEPLDQAIARVVKDVLGTAPNVESVTLGSRGGNGTDCDIALRVLACEGVRESAGAAGISFKVAWEVRSGESRRVTQRGVFVAAPAEWNGTDYGQLAERLSEAARQLGSGLQAQIPGAPN